MGDRLQEEDRDSGDRLREEDRDGEQTQRR